jgi:Domain of unknown function (DUF4129)
VVAALRAGAGGAPYAFRVGGPPLIGRNAGRELARRELAKHIYHQGVSLTERILERIAGFLGRLFDQVNATVPGGWWAVVVLVALAVIVLGIVLTRLGPISLAHRAPGAPLLGTNIAAARDHRERAQQLAAAGDWAAAIREILRAMARDLEERAILPPRPGRTTDEFALEAGRALPRCAAELWSAARLFDDVWYGERPGTADGYARLTQLDAAVRAASPVPLEPAGAAGSAM